MKVLIAGCGDVGTSLGVVLAKQGHEVYGLRRTPDALPECIKPVKADLTDPMSLAVIPGELDLVYYTAATSERSERGYRQAYVDGLSNVLEKVQGSSSHLRHVFFTSSTSVYGQTDGSWVTEESLTAPAHYSGKIILEGEALLARADVGTTSIRFGGIYGPGRTYLIRTLIESRAGLKPSEAIFTNRIHRDDCAGFLAPLAGLDSPAPLYLGVDDDPAPYNDVMRFIANELGMGVPPLAGEAQRDRMRGNTNKRCSNRRLRSSGYQLRYPSYREGYRELVSDYPR